MYRAVYTWACDQCGETKERKSAGHPTYWRRVTVTDDVQVIFRGDFCSVECRDAWMAERKLTKNPESVWGEA